MSFRERHFEGPGGIMALLGIALPMIVSQASETIMMFVDRQFLGQLSPQHLAAAMGGGLTAFVFVTFFMGLAGYANALVAQYYGAGQPQRCPVAAFQALLIAVASFPLILACIPLGPWLFSLLRHDPVQQELEYRYFRILMFNSFFTLARTALCSFFAGVGRTRVIMFSSAVALLVNTVANYALIFGHWGCPRLDIEGSAYGIILGNAVGLAILVWAFFSARHRREFGTHRGLRFDRQAMGTLLRFGYPNGVEFFLAMAAFNLIVQVFQGYDTATAAAVTIAFNWDMVAFIPMIGVNVGVLTLVGQAMGAGRPDLAARATWSGLKVAYLYSGTMVLLFVLVPDRLAAVFVPRDTADPETYRAAAATAELLLRLSAIYLFSDATQLVFGGALRGAGDTRWAMLATVATHWFLATLTTLAVKVLKLPAIPAWGVFVGIWVFAGLVFYLRFRGGKWRAIRMVQGPAEVREPALAEGPSQG